MPESRIHNGDGRQPSGRRDCLYSVRVGPDFRERVLELAGMMGAEAGTKLSQGQALEMLVNGSLKKRKKEDGKGKKKKGVS